MLDRCPACGGNERVDVLSLGDLPVLINARTTPAEAPSVARGPMDLVCCTDCTHLYNRSFDAALVDYDAAYENTLHFSPHFQKFAKGLIERLITDHDLIGKSVVDIGCGPGHFLAMLCAAGVGEGFGFDPSYDAERMGAPDHAAVKLSTDMYPADGSVPVDLAMSQHVLEHLEDPQPALHALRNGVTERSGAVYTEVPNGQLMVEATALWDLIYEHLSYFTPLSLGVALHRAGLVVQQMDAAYADQFLWAEALPGEPSDVLPDAQLVAAGVQAAVKFGTDARRMIAKAQTDLEAAAKRGPVVVWGAGSKGMTYLNLVEPSLVAGVIDINPRKRGSGVPGTSLVVSGPEDIAAIGPTTALVANPVYAAEIGETIAAHGADAIVTTLW